MKPNKIVCTTLIGTERLYNFANNNPLIELQPVEFTHGGRVLSQIENFHAINSALEIDFQDRLMLKK